MALDEMSGKLIEFILRGTWLLEPTASAPTWTAITCLHPADSVLLFICSGLLVWTPHIEFNSIKQSLTLCLRVQVHYWTLEEHVWTDHSSETHSWILETLICPPLSPQEHSSSGLKSVWEVKQWHWLWAQNKNQETSLSISLKQDWEDRTGSICVFLSVSYLLYKTPSTDQYTLMVHTVWFCSVSLCY